MVRKKGEEEPGGVDGGEGGCDGWAGQGDEWASRGQIGNIR